MIRALASGSLRMISGQAADLAGQAQPAGAELVEFIHLRKTASLLAAACRLGALAAEADASSVECLERFGLRLGLAFQIVDDVLDCTRPTQELGKTAGKDAAAAKQSYPVVHGVAESRRQAQNQMQAAVAALAPLGARADRLRQIAEFVVNRQR
jgi:geranylgeranyl pyrophosphate synthase